jgi:hypothetical protein
MAAAPAIMMIASAVIGAYAAVQSSKAQSATYKAAAQADKYNAEIKAQTARVARQQANAREEAQRRMARQVLGEQRAALAQAGAGLSGSAADIYGQSAANAELDALNIRYEGELDARGLLAQSAQDTYQSKVNKMNAGSATKGGYLSGASQLLAGASNAYGSYKKGGS